MFTRLKALKVEIEHLQLLMDRAKVKLQKEFEAWWAAEASSLQVWRATWPCWGWERAGIAPWGCQGERSGVSAHRPHALSPGGVEQALILITGNSSDLGSWFPCSVSVTGKGGGWRVLAPNRWIKTGHATIALYDLLL